MTVMFAFLADGPVALPARHTVDTGVGEVRQGDPAVVLNDAGAASFDEGEIDRLVTGEGISMLCLSREGKRL